MDIENGKSSRQLAYLIQFLDKPLDDRTFFFDLVNKYNTPEELAQSSEYEKITERKRFYQNISINNIVQIMKRYE